MSDHDDEQEDIPGKEGAEAAGDMPSRAGVLPIIAAVAAETLVGGAAPVGVCSDDAAERVNSNESFSIELEPVVLLCIRGVKPWKVGLIFGIREAIAGEG